MYCIATADVGEVCGSVRGPRFFQCVVDQGNYDDTEGCESSPQSNSMLTSGFQNASLLHTIVHTFKMDADIKSRAQPFYIKLSDREVTPAFRELLVNYTKIPENEINNNLEAVVCHFLFRCSAC
jgi:hypothetical protein